MVVDTVNFDQYCEVLLLQKLGYVMFAEVDGQEYLVKQARMVGGDGRNLEVLTMQGWRTPTRCWATLDERPRVEVTVQQESLFQ